MPKPEAVKMYEGIEADLDKHQRLVRLGITLDQTRDRINTLQEEIESLYETARQSEIEINEITGKVIA